jgi:glycosyltransferase involved in cell wall biosynthesis
VFFPGAIYDQQVVRSLRYHANFYVHGHRVGGTNPSLVEAMGAGSAVIAHDNVFNRWVAGPEARFFATEADCDMHISALIGDPATATAMGIASAQRFRSTFRWDNVLAQYEALLDRHGRPTRVRQPAGRRPLPGAKPQATAHATRMDATEREDVSAS